MIEFELLLKVVEEVEGTKKEDLLSKRKFRRLAELRVICSTILKENHKKLTDEKIGALMLQDRCTIIYQLKNHKILLVQHDGKYKRMYEEISKQYKRALDLSGEMAKVRLLEKRDKVEKMLEEINITLQILDDKNKIKESV